MHQNKLHHKQTQTYGTDFRYADDDQRIFGCLHCFWFCCRMNLVFVGNANSNQRNTQIDADNDGWCNVNTNRGNSAKNKTWKICIKLDAKKIYSRIVQNWELATNEWKWLQFEWDQHRIHTRPNKRFIIVIIFHALFYVNYFFEVLLFNDSFLTKLKNAQRFI